MFMIFYLAMHPESAHIVTFPSQLDVLDFLFNLILESTSLFLS